MKLQCRLHGSVENPTNRCKQHKTNLSAWLSLGIGVSNRPGRWMLQAWRAHVPCQQLIRSAPSPRKLAYEARSECLLPLQSRRCLTRAGRWAVAGRTEPRPSRWLRSSHSEQQLLMISGRGRRCMPPQ